ncbi:hypothetical protein SAMN05216524_1102 [Mucilaginibacter sp. OK098]|nr:hypothetical protein SAMN05216524_1102 [Mucilaginibacter sp. OK098]
MARCVELIIFEYADENQLLILKFEYVQEFLSSKYDPGWIELIIY